MKTCDPRIKERENCFAGLSTNAHIEKNKMINELRNKDKNLKLSQNREIMKNVASDFILENKENCLFNFNNSENLLDCVSQLKFILPYSQDHIEELISLFYEGVQQDEKILNDLFDNDTLTFIAQNIFNSENKISIPLMIVIVILALRQFKIDLQIKLNIHQIIKKAFNIDSNSNISFLIVFYFSSLILSSQENAKIILHINILPRLLILAFNLPKDSSKILALNSFIYIIESIQDFPSEQLIEIIDPLMASLSKLDEISNKDLRISLLESIEQISLKPEINSLYEKLNFDQLTSIIQSDNAFAEKVIVFKILCNLLENNEYDFSETLIQRNFVQICVSRFFQEELVTQESISKFLISMSLNLPGMVETFKNSCDKLFLHLLENSDNSFLLECSCCYLALIVDYKINYNHDKVLESLIVRIYRSTEGLFVFICLLLHYFQSSSVEVIQEYLVYETEKIVSCLFNSNQDSQIISLATNIQESLEKRKHN